MQMPEVATSPNNLTFGAFQPYSRTIEDKKFPGIGATGWTPADPDLAVGTNHIVSVVNSSIAFFTKTGTLQFQQTAGTFFSGMGAGSFIFDPKCFYDKFNNRYVVVFLEEDDASQTSKLLFAVSDDGDPNGTWFRYRIESKLVLSGAGYWLDYPGFGGNADSYMVTGNMFGFVSGFAGVQFIVIPSAPVLSGAAVTTTSLRDAAGASVQVAESQAAGATGLFAISRSGTSAMRVYCVTNPTTAPALSAASVAVPAFSTPSGDASSTSGRFLDALDGRVMNAVWRGGRVCTSHAVQSGSFIASRWYELDMGSWPSAGTPTLVQSGQIGSSSYHYFMPAVNKNAAGSISAIFTRSNTATTADVAVAGRLATDAAGTMGAPQILASSSGNNYTQGRWGDYFGCDVDPTDDSLFWGVAMTVSSTNGWATQIVSWNVNNTPPPVSLAGLVLTPSTVVGGNPSTGTVTLSGPAPTGGFVVSVSSSNTNRATVPASVTVSQGALSANFPVTTFRQGRTRTVTITATANGVTKTAVLTLTR